MKINGNWQISGDLKARNFPQEVKDFYGITVKQVRTSDGNIHSYSGINLVSFNDQSFYLEQNALNRDEVLVNFRGSSSTGVTSHSALSGLGADDHTQYALADRTRPTLWNVKITDGSNIQTDDTINFNRNDFYVSANLTGQPVINANSKSVAFFMPSATQTTNIAVGDHLKFDTVMFSRGSNISLDTTSAYTNASGASLGRITLQPNRVYEITGVARPVFVDATGALSIIISNDSGTQFGAAARQIALTGASPGADVGNTESAVAMVAPTVATRYEVRLSAVTALTSISGGTASVSFVKIIEL